jgi:hypothetical protein
MITIIEIPRMRNKKNPQATADAALVQTVPWTAEA